MAQHRWVVTGIDVGELTGRGIKLGYEGGRKAPSTLAIAHGSIQTLDDFVQC
jgi:hypothetical protein